MTIQFNNSTDTITATTGTGTFVGFTVSASLSITDDTSTNATRYVTFTSATSGSITGENVSSTKLTFNPSTGTLTATVVSASSDERLKADWQNLPADFVEQLASTKSGTYTLIEDGSRHAGASAQSWQKLLPEVVGAHEDGTLHLAYGNAALVSAVELAKRVVAQEARIAKLEALVAELTKDRT